jgi:hypothetical protein
MCCKGEKPLSCPAASVDDVEVDDIRSTRSPQEEQGTSWSSCAAQQRLKGWALQVHPGDPTDRSQSKMTLTLVERPLQPGPVCGTDAPLFAVEGSSAVGVPGGGSFHQQIITLGLGGA